MFHFQTLDVYKCAVAFLPKAYAMASLLDSEWRINSDVHRSRRDQRKFLVTARGSALECTAVLDAMQALGIQDGSIAESYVLLVRVVSMLTKMID